MSVNGSRKNAILDQKKKQLAKTTTDALQASSSTQNAVVVPDPFPMKAIPPNVLTEEDYTDAVSHIIERDFFPDLPHLRIKKELLDARASGEQALANALEQELINMSRPTPLTAGGATPGRLTPAPTPLAGFSGAATPAGATPQLSAWERDDDVASSVADPPDRPSHARLSLASGKDVVVDLEHVRLDDFQRVFTSEDNASFEEILKRDKKAKMSRQWWIEDMELQHNTAHQNYKNALQDGSAYEKESNGLLGTEHRGRNAFNFKPPTLPVADIEKPKVDFKNTRFTTAQQAELDGMLDAAVATRQANMMNEEAEENADRMARSGKFGLSAFQAQGIAGMRAVGGKLATPLLPERENVRGYPLVHTPTLLPGVGGLSPLMTYGKVGSTPRVIEEEGPVFRMNETSAREQAAEKLQRGATQKIRETKQQTRAERFRALGLTPPGTPGKTSRSTPGASTSKNTPSLSAARVSPLSPIGALLQRAQKLAQKGGRLRIARSPTPATPIPPPAEEPARKRRKKASAETPEIPRLPASITDDLL